MISEPLTERQQQALCRPCSALRPGHRHCQHGHTEDCPDPGECDLLPIGDADESICEANARQGTGTGLCGRPLDRHGLCDRAADHLGEAP